ncbi:uncharacterized protein LOC111628603 isoform X5 [Centruroides sculpturatus]|uniref:uncharacterized protein LOC111628603 isoform X5 n=2 Tax=Centruroides sculpturatus TaxID=218467 RepID=UPI000C6CF9B1|nr:uncharacterized protein LOC111628603 isoform X5 [Centruroides sculpturatus]
MIFMTRCCCFFDTRIGSIACGVYTLATRIFGIVTCVAALISPKLQKTVSMYHNGNLSDLKSIYVSILINNFIAICFSILLVYGTRKNYKLALIPWVVWMIIELIVHVVYVGVLIVFSISNAKIVGLIIGIVCLISLFICLQVYFILCVISYYEYLKENDDKPIELS